MALRLVGEETGIRGIDGEGWLREIQASSDPMLKLAPPAALTQSLRFNRNGGSLTYDLDVSEVAYNLRLIAGAAKEIRFFIGATEEAKLTATDLVLGGVELDAQTNIKNSGAANGGAVRFADNVRIIADSDPLLKLAPSADETQSLRFNRNGGSLNWDIDVSEMAYNLRLIAGAAKEVHFLLGASQQMVLNATELQVVGSLYLQTGGQGISYIPDATAGAATVDDLTKKRFRVVKRATAPTSAYIAFSNNPGTDTFYLILEDV